MTTPPPSINISAPSDGGGEGDGDPSDGGGGDDTTSAAAPDIPAPDPEDFPGMDEETPEGAEQAYRYYWAVMDWAHQTGDIGEIGNLSADSCDVCVRYIDTVQELLEADGLWKGPVQTDVDVSSISDSAELSDEGYDVAVIYGFVLSEHSVVDEESGERVSEPEATYRTTGGLVWNGERWVVDGCAIQPLEEITG